MAISAVEPAGVITVRPNATTIVTLSSAVIAAVEVSEGATEEMTIPEQSTYNIKITGKARQRNLAGLII